MALKYFVIEEEDGQLLAGHLFKFEDPTVALEVARQLSDKNYGRDYVVVVKDE